MSGWFGETTYFSGSFGLSSTARDYLHFQQMLLNGGELFGRRLLGPRTVTMMTSNHVGHVSVSGRKGGPGRGAGYAVGVITRSDCGGQPAQCRGIRLGRRVRHRVLVRPGRGNRRRHHAAATLRESDPRLRKRRAASDHRLTEGRARWGDPGATLVVARPVGPPASLIEATAQARYLRRSARIRRPRPCAPAPGTPGARRQRRTATPLGQGCVREACSEASSP